MAEKKNSNKKNWASQQLSQLFAQMHEQDTMDAFRSITLKSPYAVPSEEERFAASAGQKANHKNDTAKNLKS